MVQRLLGQQQSGLLFAPKRSLGFRAAPSARPASKTPFKAALAVMTACRSVFASKLSEKVYASQATGRLVGYCGDIHVETRSRRGETSCVLTGSNLAVDLGALFRRLDADVMKRLKVQEGPVRPRPSRPVLSASTSSLRTVASSCSSE